ncbi:hypothetical protein AVEN_9513-1 [Araneus ventricosus]|uniref:Uncharacterized protein n=1 Tax=Araneus ventricosus TaxID=182803 RepID=A0A4Y2Q3S6_ARAVE|nr:hypothetical protein AVEN_9513-1 [Araneus ventricosus]
MAGLINTQVGRVQFMSYPPRKARFKGARRKKSPRPQLDQVQESARPQKNYWRTTHGKGGGYSFCWHSTLDARGKKSDFVHCLYALTGSSVVPPEDRLKDLTCEDQPLQAALLYLERQ